MLTLIKKLLKGPEKREDPEKQLEEWIRQGKPAPPPHIVKQQAIREYAEQYGTGTLVETGTYLGDMIAAQLDHFTTIISIELSAKLHKKAKERFRQQAHVKLYQGDSSHVLPQIMPTLQQPAIFWLDGHYSAGMTARGDKDCPVYEELDAIFSHDTGHVILIDDAREFIGKNDYPTIPALEAYIKSKNPAYTITVKDDIIRAVRS